MTHAAPVFSLAGETALITGGGTGIGLGIAEAFVAAGAKVVLAGRREHPLREAADRLGPNASYTVLDVADYNNLDGPVAEIQATHGFIGILVNNAGNSLKKDTVDTTEAEFLSIMDTHVTGAFALTRRLIPAMKERGHGNILFMASMASLMGLPRVIAYTAAKSAHVGMVRSLASELSGDGIRVNAIAPGWIESAMTRRAFDNDPERKARVLARTPMRRMGEPADIGAAAVYLCSPAAKFVTGVLLPVDGGASIGF
ncbi:MAG: SDR family oxidoreductase [Bryobacteraceae bacterium]|nr:SDR family oxidoreductase [Bryobacteraceae bacterium]